MLLSLPDRRRPLLLATIPLTALLWAYWTTLADMRQTWTTDPRYSHGYLVPVFALLLLWLRRGQLHLDAVRPSWWGLPLLALALVLRLGGTHYGYTFFDSVSVVPCLAAVCLMVGGWAALRWAWPAVLFLCFMIPLPYSVATALVVPLQGLATVASTFALQTIGLPALAEGNIIRINDAQIGIVEACSGLRMLVVFFALSTGMALVIKVPLGDRLFLVASSVPIALVVNVIRITVTGMLHEMVDSETANVFYHDVAGLLMPPLALVFLWMEWKLLGLLLVEVLPPGRAGSRTRPRGAAPTRQARATRSPRRPTASEPAAETHPEEAPRPEHVSAQGRVRLNPNPPGRRGSRGTEHSVPPAPPLHIEEK